MPTVLNLSSRETVDLFKVTALEAHTGSIVVQTADGPSRTLSPGDSLLDPPAGGLEVRGPGRIKYWVEGECYEEAAAPRGDTGGTGGSYESRTEKELYELARDRDIRGRSKMNKEQLIDALRAAGGR